MSFSRLLAALLAALLGLVTAPAAFAAHADPLEAVSDEDREALEALALYPDEVRGQILEVASEAGTLVELDEMQEDSQQAFRDLLDPYGRDDQEQLFELSRYPELVEEIAEGGAKSEDELERIAERYPEEIRDAAVRQGRERRRVIGRMHALLSDFDSKFNDLIADFPPEKQEAFRAVLGMPEVMALLTGHMQLTALLGDAYERDPAALRASLAELSLEVARRNAEDAEDWKKSVDSDPDLRRDYASAARDYERDTGYSAYGAPRTSVHVSVYPYPYWFGYPWWYPIDYVYYDPWYWWYPRRWWGHCGYYFGPRVVVGASFGGPIWRPWWPTPFFASWYFSFGHHHAHYPYLSDHFISHYSPVVVQNVNVVHVHNHFNPRHRVVRKFVAETDRVVPASFLRADKKVRVARLREFGRVAPELEKVQKEARAKEFGKRARPGKDFAVEDATRVSKRGERAERKQAAEILRKKEKEAPELARVALQPEAETVGKGKRGGGAADTELVEGAGKDGGAKGRAGKRSAGAEAAGGESASAGGEPGPAKLRPFEDSSRGEKNAKERTLGTDEGGRRKKVTPFGRSEGTGADAGKGGKKAKRAGEEGGASARSAGEESGGGGGTKKLRPFQDDSGARDRGGKGKPKERDVGGTESLGGDPAPRKQSRRATPSFEAPSWGGGGGEKPRFQKSERAREPSYVAPPPTFETDSGGGGSGGGGRSRGGSGRSDAPRMQRDSDGGGGGSGGGGRKKSKQEEEEQQQGGGGGGRHRNR